MFCTEKFSRTVLTDEFSSLFLRALIETIWTFILLIVVGWGRWSWQSIIVVLVVWGDRYGGRGIVHRVRSVGLEDLRDRSREK